MGKGWIKLHRKIQDCELWLDNQPFDRRSAWIDLLLLANHEDVEMLFDYEPITVSTGQYLTSIRQLSARWSWSKDRVLKFMRALEKLKMIHRDSNNKRTLITIENYALYQNCQDTDKDTDKDTGRTQSGHRVATNKNEKNEKNEKKYICSFDEFWKCYPRKQDKARAYSCYVARLNDGYTEEQLLTACKNYSKECEENKTEQRYIKHGSTFLSVNEPFLDYLKGKEDGLERKVREHERLEEEYRAYIQSDEYREAAGSPFD